MVNVPLRDCVSLFGCTVYPTVPLPVPELPELIETKAALLLAVQVQVLPVVTLTLPVPPLALKLWLAGVIE